MTKHTILFLAANPVGTDRLALDKEARAIQVELDRSGFRDCFALETRWAAEPLDLLRELRKLKPTVVHFSGHGTSSVAGARTAGGLHRDVIVEDCVAELARPGLYFQASDGRPQFVSADALAQVFRAAGASVKLVTLSACYSDQQVAALVAHVDCVIGIRGSIPDAAARSFAIGFYGALGDRESVAAAFRQGCAAIGLEGLPDINKPQLRTRDGIDGERVVLAGPCSARTAIVRDVDMLATTWSSLTWSVDTGPELLKRSECLAGHVIGNYVLGQPLGFGGTGVVFRAQHRALGQLAALKLFFPVRGVKQELSRAIERAARGLKSLRYPGIVSIFDLGYLDVASFTSAYLIMEFIEGEPLDVWSHRLGNGKTAARVEVALKIALALRAAHTCRFIGESGFAETGVIHGDVKPSNIVVRLRDAQPVLLDFMIPDLQRFIATTRNGYRRMESIEGIFADTRNKYLQMESMEEISPFLERQLTTSDFGTRGYMAPEQEFDGKVLPASDVYALGRTLNSLLFRELQLAESTPKSPWAALSDLLMIMLEKDLANRPHTMMIVCRRLRDILKAISQSSDGVHERSDIEFKDRSRVVPHASVVSDVTLLERWGRNDSASGKMFFERYYDMVARFFSSKVGEAVPDLVSDLVQETFLRCLQDREKISDDKQFRSYVFRIAYNVLMEHLRGRRSHSAFDVREQLVHDLQPGADMLVRQPREYRLLLKSLRSISIDDQVVLELHYWENLTTDEIAHTLGIPLATARIRLQHARARLAEVMRLSSATKDEDKTMSVPGEDRDNGGT